MTLVAAVLMMIGGVLDFFSGLAALIRGQFFVTLPNSTDYAFSVSIHSWGWLHLIAGAVVFVTGAALLTDHLWARIAGVVIAGLSAILNFVMLPYYPLWAIVVIALNVVIIVALCAPRRRDGRRRPGRARSRLPGGRHARHVRLRVLPCLLRGAGGRLRLRPGAARELGRRPVHPPDPVMHGGQHGRPAHRDPGDAGADAKPEQGPADDDAP